MTKKEKEEIIFKITVPEGKDEMEIRLNGKRSEIVKMLSLVIEDNDEIREMIFESVFNAFSLHLKKHGIDLKDVLEEIHMEQMIHNKQQRGKEKVVN